MALNLFIVFMYLGNKGLSLHRDRALFPRSPRSGCSGVVWAGSGLLLLLSSVCDDVVYKFAWFVLFDDNFCFCFRFVVFRSISSIVICHIAFIVNVAYAEYVLFGKKCQEIINRFIYYGMGMGGLTIRSHTNVMRGPFSHKRSHDFLWRCTYFSSLQKLTTFSCRRYV